MTYPVTPASTAPLNLSTTAGCTLSIDRTPSHPGDGLDLCVLGSGSAGNSTLVRTAAGCLLLDAGFGPRTTQRRMAHTGLELQHIRAIVLTHLDRDHFNPNLLASVVRFGIHLHCHASCIEAIRRAGERAASARKLAQLPELLHGFEGNGSFEPLPGVTFRPVHLAHDAEGSHGFHITTGVLTIGYATDLGRVPDALIALFCGVDILAIESNYDPVLEEASDRPWFLKRRIMGGSGHLSNEQAFTAVRSILDHTCRRHGEDKLPRHIVLLHRSRQCNCPNLLRQLFMRDARMAGVLTLAEQHEPTAWLRVGPPRPREVQLSFLS